jgi:septal ring factor EnvC (AmiA/AmiB activator)
MNIIKVVKSTMVTAVLGFVLLAWSGCGGVDEAQMAELNSLRDEVNSLESEANSLKEERSRLEREIADKNAKLQQCEKDKEETRANLKKLPTTMGNSEETEMNNE